MHPRDQVVRNLSTGILQLLRSFSLGLTAMGYSGRRGFEVIREGCLDAIKRLEAEHAELTRPKKEEGDER